MRGGHIRVRPYEPADEPWATEFLDRELGGRRQARRGEVHDVLAPGLGFVAEREAAPVGLATWRLDGDAGAELSAIAATPAGVGVGTALLEAVKAAAVEAGAGSLWLVTTNDNLTALRFYRRRGFHLVELRRGALDEARRLKRSIPTVGQHGIPMRDELQLEWRLDD